jgi:hypothetical protein
MRKFLPSFLFLLLSAMPAAAQFDLVTGQVVDPNGIPYSGATVRAILTIAGASVTGQPTVTNSNQSQCISAGLGNAPCQMPFPGTQSFTLDANGNIPGGGYQLANNPTVTPAGTTWTFNVTISPGIPPPLGTGPQSFSVAISISSNPQAIGATLSAAAPKLSNNAGGGITQVASLPATCNIGTQYLLPNNSIVVCGPTANSFIAVSGTGTTSVNPTAYGALFNGHRVKDASTTNTSFTVTFPNGDGPTASTAYVGEPFFCTSGSTVNSSVIVGTSFGNSTPETIASIGSNTITVTPNAATATTSATAICFWGTDDGGGLGTKGNTSLNSAWNAAAANSAASNSDVFYQMPAGMTGTSVCLWNTVTYPNNGSYNGYVNPTIAGAGEGSTIIVLFPWFSLSSCPTGGGAYPPMFGPNSSSFTSYTARDFTIDGLGNSVNGQNFGDLSIMGSGSVASPTGVVLMQRVDIIGFGNSASLQTLAGLRTSGPNSSYRDVFVDGAGWYGILATAAGNQGYSINFENIYSGDQVLGVSLEVNTPVNDFGSVYGPGGTSGLVDIQVQGSGAIYNGFGISNVNGTNSSATLQCVSSAVCNIFASYFNKSSNSTGDGCLVQSSSTLRLMDTTCIGGSSGAGISTASGTLLYNQSGNTFTAPNSVSGTLISDGHSVKGICTGSATASSTLGLYGTGPNATTTTCTSTTIGSGIPVEGSRTLQNLSCKVSTAGTTASTCTVLVNGSASTITCTIAASSTSCIDGTHTVAVTDGQLVSLEFVSGAATTPSGVQMIVEWN